MALTPEERDIAYSYRTPENRILFILQAGYFGAKTMFFSFDLREVPDARRRWFSRSTSAGEPNDVLTLGRVWRKPVLRQSTSAGLSLDSEGEANTCVLAIRIYCPYYGLKRAPLTNGGKHLTNSDIIALASQQRVSPRLVFREQLQLSVLCEMQRHPEFSSFVFQGGTALRLCYNNPRFSEDLDFVMKQEPPVRILLEKPLPWERITNALPNIFPWANGFTVQIQKATSGIQRSIVSCQTPYERGLHRLHIECVSIPAYTAKESTIRAPQDLCAITVECPEEILADKLVALGLRSYFKGRDLWDIAFLTHEKASTDVALIQKKLKDYGCSNDEYFQKLDQQRSALQQVDAVVTLRTELARFLTPEQTARFDAEDGWTHMINGALNLTASVRHSVAVTISRPGGPSL